MFARSTTFHGRPESVEAGIKYATNELVPMLDKIEGCRGLSLMVDRTTGMCIATTSWSDEAAMEASSAPLRPMRDRGRDLMGGSMEIDSWEVAVMRRSNHGACCRATWLDGDVQQMTEAFRFGVLPSLDDLRGFCAASLMINAAAGIGCMTSCWEDHEAMHASRTAATDLRNRLASDARGEVQDVHEFDLAYAHLHVPELV